MSFFETSNDNVSVRIYLTPNAKKEGFNGLFEDADKRVYLKASVNAVPEEHKANKALVKLLADELGIARTPIELVTGLQSRKKNIRVHSSDPHVRHHLERLLENTQA